MAERKRLDDGSARYLGLGRNLLAQLKQAMQVNRLQALSRTVDLPDGVRITVASVFGQDEIRIDTSAAQSAQQDDAGAPGADESAPDTVEGRIATIVTCSGSIQIEATTTTDAPPYTPPPVPPQIFIGGYITKFVNNQPINQPFIWDDVNGLRMLGLRSSFGAVETQGEVYGISADGQVPVGWVIVNGVNYAAVWRSGLGDADIISHAPGARSVAWTINDAKNSVTGLRTNGSFSFTSTITSATGPGFTWDGRMAHVGTDKGTTTVQRNMTSANGRVKLAGGGGAPGQYILGGSTNQYKLDNGPWISISGTSPNMCVATCVAHVPYTPPAPPSTQPTVTTTKLVFSG